MRKTQSALALAGVLAAGVLSGCSRGEPRYDVSGAATIEGDPIPFGEVILTPDASQGNAGPQGIAPIQDGKYDTRLPGGKGTAGGPTILRVNGMTAPGGRTLCEHEI